MPCTIVFASGHCGFPMPWYHLSGRNQKEVEGRAFNGFKGIRHDGKESDLWGVYIGSAITFIVCGKNRVPQRFDVSTVPPHM